MCTELRIVVGFFYFIMHTDRQNILFDSLYIYNDNSILNTKYWSQDTSIWTNECRFRGVYLKKENEIKMISYSRRS